MTVFRVEKNANYTVMSNEHLRNRELSLKAKGLLSQMLSLPEEWDYSLEGLSRINREGVDAIRTGIRELEEHGYRAAAPARRLRPPGRHRVRCARARRRQALAARVRRACVGFSNAGFPCAGKACVGEPEAIK